MSAPGQAGVMTGRVQPHLLSTYLHSPAPAVLPLHCPDCHTLTTCAELVILAATGSQTIVTSAHLWWVPRRLLSTTCQRCSPVLAGSSAASSSFKLLRCRQLEKRLLRGALGSAGASAAGAGRRSCTVSCKAPRLCCWGSPGPDTAPAGVQECRSAAALSPRCD